MLSDGCIETAYTKLFYNFTGRTLAYFNYPTVECGVAAAARKKALVLSLTLATFSVENKVPERRKYRMIDRSVFDSEKEKAEDFQPTKKRPTKPSAPKGKQHRPLKRYCWKSISKRYAPKIPTRWAVSTYNGLCCTQNQRSAVLKAKTESMDTSGIKSYGSIAG